MPPGLSGLCSSAQQPAEPGVQPGLKAGSGPDGAEAGGAAQQQRERVPDAAQRRHGEAGGCRRTPVGPVAVLALARAAG